MGRIRACLDVNCIAPGKRTDLPANKSVWIDRIRERRPQMSVIVDRRFAVDAKHFGGRVAVSMLDLSDVGQLTLRRTEHFKNRVLETSHSKHLPRRDELTAQATAIFARTSSMEEIVDRAYELLTDANPRSDKRVPSALRRS